LRHWRTTEAMMSSTTMSAIHAKKRFIQVAVDCAYN